MNGFTGLKLEPSCGVGSFAVICCMWVAIFDRVQTTDGCMTEPSLDCTTAIHTSLQTTIGSFRPISVVLTALIAWRFSIRLSCLWGRELEWFSSVELSAMSYTDRIGG